MVQILTVRVLTSLVLTGHEMVSVLNDDTVVRYLLERNDVTFSRPDSHLIQICVILCSSSILVRVLALGIGLQVDGGSQYRYRGGGQKLKWGHVTFGL